MHKQDILEEITKFDMPKDKIEVWKIQEFYVKCFFNLFYLKKKIFLSKVKRKISQTRGVSIVPNSDTNQVDESPV
jgi:hypothetical protein